VLVNDPDRAVVRVITSAADVPAQTTTTRG
jgi:hypothetical protein